MRYLKISMSCFGLDSIIGDHTQHLYSLEGIDAISGLEKLKISTPKIKFKLATELETLLRQNSNTLKKVKINRAKLPKNLDYALRCLTKCESLKLCLDYNWAQFPSMVSVAQLLRSSTALKELSVYPIADKRQISVIADAVKVNTSLTALTMFIAQKRCTPEPLFTAMEVSTTLKELRVLDCRINASCAQALASALRRNCSLRDLYLTDIDISSASMEQLREALLENTTLQYLHISGHPWRSSWFVVSAMTVCSCPGLRLICLAYWLH
ncbi:hypothetical protein V5799_003385 [Amblyomma americanum]|uniref:Uncharacterized protein n=1 Tax=Amblyomma americanum TaxID=6943 RepID=A0AAQ4D943_AMBAM